MTSCDPLQLVLPERVDREPWHCTGQTTAVDTHATVFHYEHRNLGRTLRLDEQARVYGQDPEGVVRLFGRGGPLALSIALNAVFDGADRYRPRRIVIPEPAGAVT